MAAKNRVSELTITRVLREVIVTLVISSEPAMLLTKPEEDTSSHSAALCRAAPLDTIGAIIEETGAI